MLENWKLLGKLMTGERKRICVGLMAALFLGSLLECVGLSLIIPVVTVISNPDFIRTNPWAVRFCGVLGLQSPDQFLKFALAMIALLFVGKNFYLLAVQHLKEKFVKGWQFELKKKLLFGFLSAPYVHYMNWSTADLVQAVETDAEGSVALLEKLLLAGGETLTLFSLGGLLLCVQPWMTLGIAFLYGGLLALFSMCVKPYLEKKSLQFVQARYDFSKWLHQTTANIKEIKAEQKEFFFMKNFDAYAGQTCALEVKIGFIQLIPRVVLEMGCVLGILLIIRVFLLKTSKVEDLFAQLSIFDLATLRMMPCVLRISQSRNSVFWNVPMLRRTVERLETMRSWGYEAKAPAAEPAPLCRGLELKNVSFRYPGTEKNIFEDASMSIPAGKLIGIGGPSGMGKTTLVDFITGLLPVDAGELLADGRDLSGDPRALAAWRAGVAYIPQDVCILDGDIRENILFGCEDAGDAPLWAALEQAQLADIVRALPQGLTPLWARADVCFPADSGRGWLWRGLSTKGPGC